MCCVLLSLRLPSELRLPSFTCQSCVGRSSGYLASRFTLGLILLTALQRSRNFVIKMRQRQDGSAAPKKMQQQGKVFFPKMRNGSASQKKLQQRKIFFEKTVTASSLPPHSQLVVPTLFVQQHGWEVHKFVTLKNVENDKEWTVEINVLFPQNRPQVLLYYGWRAFAVANDLAIGDRLTFVLVARSLFDVFILRRGGNSSVSVEKPKLRSQEPISARRETNPETNLCPRPQVSCEIPTNGCGESDLARTRALLTKETAKETYVADVAAEAPDSSRGPSGMNSHCSRQVIQPNEQECIICQIAAMTKLGMMKTIGVGFHTVFNE